MKEVEDGWSRGTMEDVTSLLCVLIHIALRYNIILLPPGVQDLTQFPIFLSFFLLFTVRHLWAN